MRIELSHSTLYLREDGILQLNSTNHVYTVADMKEINEAKYKLLEGKNAPLLVIASAYASVENDAREFMASDENQQQSSMEAFVICSLAQKILANFYLAVNKPKVPTRFFSDIISAEKWLQLQLRSHLPSDL